MDTPPVVLAAISEVQNANQLAADQLLPFALNGITLIYGDNGSGKTGYTRIVKQLCRARRERDEPLLGNVYKSSGGTAKATVTYIVDGEQKLFRWEDGKQAPSELSRISVFDASCASLYADHQNRIEFLPLGLDVMPRLGAACERLAHRLQSEINALAASISVQLPQQVQHSTAGALTQRLSIDTRMSDLPQDADIRAAAAWSGLHQERLKAIEIELQKLSEPAKAAAQCRRFRTSREAFLRKMLPISEDSRQRQSQATESNTRRPALHRKQPRPLLKGASTEIRWVAGSVLPHGRSCTNTPIDLTPLHIRENSFL